ncbi:Flp family type IVb pilin [Endozoicomonadaceae bacterium StTr2]
MLTKLYVKSAMMLDALKQDQRGVTAIEYALIAAGVAGVLTVAFTGDSGAGGTVTNAIKAAFTKIQTALQ